jgi:signal transduction histidine kinase
MNRADRVGEGLQSVCPEQRWKGLAVAARHESTDDVDPCLVLGEVAVLLAEQGPPGPALTALEKGLGLAALGLRDLGGRLVAGTTAPARPVLEIPVHGRAGALLGTLVAVGALPSQLPALRSAAAVLGLALSPAASTDVEDDRDALADALHDGPVQSLVVARYASDAAVRGGDATAARDAVQAALVEARRFLWQLRPRGSAGLVEAMDQLSTHLVEAGGAPLGLVGDVEAAAALRGPAGVTAYRLVQAVAKPDGPAVRVGLRTDGDRLVVDVDGGVPLSSPERWLRRAQALGGDLQTSAGRLRLLLPHPEARTNP